VFLAVGILAIRLINSFAEKKRRKSEPIKSKDFLQIKFPFSFGVQLTAKFLLYTFYSARNDLLGGQEALWVPRNVSRAHTRRFLEPNLFLRTFASSIAASVNM
jgi:hypothetical protein